MGVEVLLGEPLAARPGRLAAGRDVRVLGEEQRLVPALLDQSRNCARAESVVGGEVADSEVHGPAVYGWSLRATAGEEGGAASTGEEGGAAPAGDEGGAAPAGDEGGAASTGEDGGAAPAGEEGGAAPAGEEGGAASTGEDGAAGPAGEAGGAAPAGEEGG